MTPTDFPDEMLEMPSNETTSSVCNGEYTFCLMLHHLAYPSRLFSLKSKFGREFSQLSRIFNHAVTFMSDTHKQKVQENLSFYFSRFDVYHRAVLRRIRISSRNVNAGFIHVELVDIFEFWTVLTQRLRGTLMARRTLSTTVTCVGTTSYSKVFLSLTEWL